MICELPVVWVSLPSGSDPNRLLDYILIHLSPSIPPSLLLSFLFSQSIDEEMEEEASRHGFSCIMLKPLRMATMATALLQVWMNAEDVR